jgi:hypothetical protein
MGRATRPAALLAVMALLVAIVLGTTAASASAPALTVEATEVNLTNAFAKGTVNPGGKDTSYHFEYATQKQFEDGEWPGQAGFGSLEGAEADNSAHPVQVTLEGLAAETGYHLRLLANNEDGDEEAETTFQTDPATAPALTIEPPTGIGYRKAEFKGTIDPEGGNVDGLYGPQPIPWAFEVAPEAEPTNWQNAGGGEISASDPGNGDPIPALTTDPIEVEAKLTELHPGTKYLLRLVANYAGRRQILAGEAFETLVVDAPLVTLDPAGSVTDTSAHFSGTVEITANPDDAFTASCAFEYLSDAEWNEAGESFSGAKSLPCTPPTVSGSDTPQPVDVEADVSGLQPSVLYHLRLVATNAAAATTAEDTFTTVAVKPTLGAFAAGPVQADRASLNGWVNPHNSPTTYWFEWGTSDCSANPCQSLPTGQDADAGEGPFNTYVSQQLENLDPESTYHFRLIAENEAGTTEGPDGEFTTATAPAPCANAGALGAARLPDCRAWEMVSPPQKIGADVNANSDRIHVAADANAVTFSATGAFDAAHGTSIDTEYLATRTLQPDSNGWESRSITPLSGSLNFFATRFTSFPGYVNAFTPDLSEGVFQSWRPLTDAPNVAEASNLYRISGLAAGEPSPSLLTDSLLPAPDLPSFQKLLHFEPWFVGASTDLSHVVFLSKLPLTSGPGSPDGEYPYDQGNPQVRLFDNAEGQVRLVGRIPQGSETECDDASGSDKCEVAEASMAGLRSTSSVPAYADRMVSADGSRILFEAPLNGNAYLREDGLRTYQLNASEKAVPDPSPQPAAIWEASRDGSRAFFITGEQLLDEDKDTAPDLYMYDVLEPAGSRLTLISASSVSDGNVGAVIGASDDGRYVYFVSSGQAVPGEPPPADLPGLYLWHDGDLSYVGGFTDTNRVALNTPRTGRAEGVQKTSRISPDGRHLLFTDLGDQGWKGRGGFPGYEHEGIRELYLYSADSGRLLCASCDPSGEAPTGSAWIGHKQSPTTAPTSGLSHALSDDGRFVFFSTSDSLVEEDTNGVMDAYRYDARERSVALISSGTDDENSFFLGASDDGRDAFFTTRERLSARDVDGAYDLYDARIGGGVPEPRAVPAPCEGESCRSATPPAPPPAPTGSASLIGAGNPKSCRRGSRRIRRNQQLRCVKKKSKSKKRSSDQGRGANTNGRAAK